MSTAVWKHSPGEGSVIAVALHDGHEMRQELVELLALDEASRLREEDPFTGEWTACAPSSIVALRSRFEIDLNRPRDEAVYRTPDDAWGLEVWKSPLPDDVVQRSLEEHDAFYASLGKYLEEIEDSHGRFVVLDLHSYNHRREGPQGPPADTGANPQVNLGTGTMDRARWAPLVDRFIADLRDYDFPGGKLDVRENVKFIGRALPTFVHRNFPRTGCALALEFKKFFMDEWTGTLDRTLHGAIGKALAATLPGIQEELARR